MVLPLLIPAAVSIASQVFPLLVTKIAGDKAGEVAEKVVNTAAAVAGMPPDTPPDEIIRRVQGDPEAMERLRYEFELLNQREHERILDDRQNAREYQIRVGAKGRTRGDWMLIGAGIGLLVCVMTIVIAQRVGDPLADGELALLTTVSGVLLKMISDAFAFEFGSSRGSREKDATITEFKQALTQIGTARRGEEEAPRERREETGAREDAARRRASVPPSAGEGGSRPRRDFVGELVSGGV